MDLRDRILSSRPFAITLLTILILIAAVMITVAVIVGRITWANMRLSTICPDYFSYEYAYVVDEQGRGIDSAAISLWDNSNINMIYRTFTDHNGRFVLFHDFGSFALSRIPFSYFLYVSVEGWSDTIRYSFEKYRVCHFRKKDGPDTIVCNLDRRSKLTLRLEQATTVIIDTGYSFVSYDEFALSNRVPTGVTANLPFDTLFLTTLPIGSSRIAIAVAPIRDYRIMKDKAGLLTEGTWYWIDRDADNNLDDEQPAPFFDRNEGGGKDCTAGTCRVIDSVTIGAVRYFLDLQLRGLDRPRPLLRFRRADALRGMATVDSSRYALLLWDHRCVNYAGLSSVMLGIDRNNDGHFDGREGSRELYEHACGRIVFDTLSFVIDTIPPDGLRLFCSDIKQGNELPSEAMIGTWAEDFKASAACPVSLYHECGEHRYVVLYFFEGPAADFMEAPEINTFIALMRAQLGPTRIIGINRRPTGALYSRELVINESRGWRGPLVRRFHNHRTEEIVCLDNTATIVYRGTVGIGAITEIWKSAGLDEAGAVFLYEQQYAGREVAPPEF
ncbi:MAG: hypothetical protein JXA18_10420 [Chitinispirillaceae bacterium]|nr:hypothetical protein [Chitinispirillaceae bacterium]